MKWSHRVLLKNDFLTEWQARECACELAHHLSCADAVENAATFDGLPSRLRAVSPRPHSSFRQVSNLRTLRVGFADELELFLGMEDEIKMFRHCIPVSAGIDKKMTGTCRAIRPVPACVTLASSRSSESSPHVPIDSPASHDSPSLHRLEPEPSWAPGMWELLRNEGDVEVDGEGPVVFVNSFYINHRHHLRHDEPRPMRFDVDFRDWENDIKFVWEDLVEAGEPLDVSIVQPDPPHAAFPGTVATIIIHQRQVPERAAILTTTVHISDPTTRFSSVAHSATRELSHFQILQIADVAEVCQLRAAQGYGTCTILSEREVVPADAVLHLHHGLGLQIRVPAPMSEAEQEQNLVTRIAQRRALRTGDRFDPAAFDDDPEEHHPRPDYERLDPEDSSSFMARRFQLVRHSTSSTSRSRSRSDASSTSSTSGSSHSSDTPFWRLTVVFSLDGQSRSLRLPWGDRPHMIALVARIFMLYENEIAQLHRVSHRPSDFIQNDLECVLLRRHSEPRPNNHMCFVLVDVTVFECGQVLPAQNRRFVRWFPSTMTRRSTFRLLGLDSHCINSLLDCTLWHNNVIIPETAHRPLQFHDDDYVRVLIVDPACICPLDEPEADTVEVSLIQTSSIDVNMAERHLTVSSASVCKASEAEVEHQNLTFPITPLMHSFTEAFLNALRLFNQAAEDLPDFPSDPEDNLDMHDPWVRSIYAAWNAQATIGPGGVERLGRLETWFSDHLNFQRCHFTRIAVLGGDFARWEQELRILWRDHVLPGAVLEFHVVDPLPEDAATQIIGQLILVQRPVRYQRSLP
eukprot:s146_g18.t1